VSISLTGIWIGFSMLQKFVDDFRESTGSALKQTSLALAAAIFLFVTVSFLCAAAFVFVLDRYGLIQACLTGAGVFFIATLLAAMSYAVQKRQNERKPKEASPSAMQTALSDPMVLAAGLQIVRTIGIKRIIPLLAIAGVALGLMAHRNTAAKEEPGE
jgi:hypothetical protein